MERILDGAVHVTIAVAEEELKTTHLKVLMLLKKGTLSGCLVEGEWYVEKSSLDCLKLHGIEPVSGTSCATSCNPSACGCKGR